MFLVQVFDVVYYFYYRNICLIVYIIRYRVYMYILIINMSKINNGSVCGFQCYFYIRFGVNNIVN